MAAARAQGGRAVTGALVSASDLAEALASTEPPVVIDVTVVRDSGGYNSGRAVFEAEGHLPGARFADAVSELSDPSSGLPFTLPEDGRVQLALGRLGVSPSTAVVVYDRLSGAWAARLWYLLRALGHARVSVLDGGLRAWREAGLSLERGAARAVEPVIYDREMDLSWFARLDEVRRYAAEPESARLVCGLRAEDFDGTSSAASRRGHIPGSVNVPYLSLLDGDGRLDRVRAAEFAALLRDDDLPAVLYCGGGINAAGLALALHVGGFDEARLYDGSLSEWFLEASLPLDVGPGRPWWPVERLV